MMEAPILDKLAHLPKARQVRPGGWIARCPVHEDENPSLTWATGAEGRALIKCHAGCATEDIVSAVGMEMADLFVSNGATARAVPAKPREVARYGYHDADNNLLFEVVRLEPKSFRQRRPDGQGGWIWNRDGVDPVLFNLPELRAANPERTVLIVEGEKDVTRLMGEFVVTTNVGGAGKWRTEYAEELRGRKVAILPDNDDVGRQHAVDVTRSLFGIAADVRVVELPGLPSKGDVSDWADARLLELGDTRVVFKELKQIIVATVPIAEAPQRETSERSEEREEQPGVLSHYSLVSLRRDWPRAPDAAAFAGFAGELVDLSDAHTEADRVAVLVQHLIAFGNVVGAGPHVMVGATRHGANTNVVLVGATSKARKGDSERPVRIIGGLATAEWSDHRIIGGLGSGEVVVWSVRDPIDKVTEQGEIVTVDAGEPDKRLLIFEPELVRILRIAGRAGSILSPIIRDAWDRGDLRTMTKNAPARATGAHISIIAHSTIEELRRELTDVEMVNGFANRFLWIAVRRSKELPEPAPFEGDKVIEIADQLHQRVAFASSVGRVVRDPEARELWAAEYHELSADRPGLAGAIQARAEAHVVRLSLVYALLDKSDTIGLRHLQSALALWRYVERSVGYIFGNATGDPIADAIESALKANEANEGLSRTQISGLFGRHESQARIAHALSNLLAAGRVRTFTRETGGRHFEMWMVGGSA